MAKYVFPGLGVFLDEHTKGGTDRAELVGHHSKPLNRIAHFLAQASISSTEAGTAEQCQHARRLLRLYARALKIAEAMIDSAEDAMSIPRKPEPKRPEKP